MKTILPLMPFAVFSYLLSLLVIYLVKKWAVKIQLVDCPNHRKVHQNPVPLVGGIAVFLTSLIMLSTTVFQKLNFAPYILPLVTSCILVVIGIIDDKYDLRAKYKLVMQLVLAGIISLDGTRITSFFGLFGIDTLDVWLQHCITIIMITGVVNAFNLMDGIDGLVGSLSLLGFVFFFLVSLYLQQLALSIITLIFIGAILGFLRYNLSQSKIFMGDAGSLGLGFLLVTMGIQMIQHEVFLEKSDSIYSLLILFAFFTIPVFDSLRVYMGRIKKGISPFQADKSHLHHLLLASGLTHHKSTLYIVLFCLFFFIIMISLAPWLSITTILITNLLIFWLFIRIVLSIVHFQEWKSILRKRETNKQYNDF